MPLRYHANNFRTTLNGTISAAATSMILTSVTGLPNIASGGEYFLTLSSGGAIEIVKVTARSSFTLTIVRAQESTTAQIFPTLCQVDLRATADSFDRKMEGIASSVDNTVPRFDGTDGKTIQSSTVAISDSNNLTANNIQRGYTTVATAAGTTTLTVASTGQQFFTGTTTQTVTLPVASTLTLGHSYIIVNNSSGIVTANSSGADVVQALAANSSATITCILASGTTAASWSVAYSLVSGGGGSVAGSTTQVQYNDTGAFAGDAGFTYDATNDTVAVGNLRRGYTTVATAAGTTVLTVASTGQQFFTGTTTQTVTLPVASTLVLGHQYSVVNSSSGVVTLQSSGANTVQTMAANTSLTVTCILASGTTAASWSVAYIEAGVASVAGSTTQVQYNDTGAFAGDAGFTYDATNDIATVGNLARASTSTATAAGTTTLTIASTGVQVFTGSAAQTIRLPVTSTLTLGHTYTIINNSSAQISIQSSGANVIQSMLGNTSATFTCILITGTTAASWSLTYSLAYAAGSTTQVQYNNGGVLGGDAGFTYDATNNIATVGNLRLGYTTVATAAGTTVLTVASTGQQFFTGATTQIARLPVVSTLALGHQYTIVNNSTGVVTINSSGSNIVQALAAGTSATVTCILTTGTTAASWSVAYTAPAVAGSTTQVQYNDAGVLAGDAGFTYDATNDIATVGNLNRAYTTVATAAGTTTLTVASTGQQFFTGTTTQTVTLPVASTLTLGHSYSVTNNSTGIVTINSSGANTVQAMAANSFVVVTCILASGTTAASWSVAYSIKPRNALIQRVSTTVAAADGTTSIPADNTIPQDSEGTQIATLAITPTNAANILKVRLNCGVSNSVGAYCAVALFYTTGGVNAVAADLIAVTTTGSRCVLDYEVAAGVTTALTFTARIGVGSGTWYVNSNSSAITLGAVIAAASVFEIYEYTP